MRDLVFRVAPELPLGKTQKMAMVRGLVFAIVAELPKHLPERPMAEVFLRSINMSPLLEGVEVLVCNFNGVICATTGVKREAWHKVLDEQDRGADEVLQKIVDAKVGDRYEILRQTFYVVGVETERIPVLVQLYAERYENLTQEGIKTCGMFPGTKEALTALAGRFQIYLDCQTPRESLMKTLEYFGITGFFKGIHDSSGNVLENLKRIIGESGIASEKILMIGSDDKHLSAAMSCGVRFMGVSDKYNKWEAGKTVFPLIADLRSLVGLPA